ncbi:MAG: Flp family type IVb pilin [Actinomycetes bacterium]
MSSQEAGATAVEYALMLACVFVVIAASVTALGQGVLALFDIPPF